MIIRNGMLYLVARLVPGILAVATTAVLTRVLTPAAYGVYGLTLIIMSFGSTIAFEWLGLSFMRFFEGRQDDPRTIPTFVALYYGMVALTGLALFVGAISTLIPAEEIGIFAIGLVMAWSFAFFELLARFEIASFRPLRYLVLNLGRAALLMICTVGAAWLTDDALYTAAGNALGLILAIVPAGYTRLAIRPRLFNEGLAREVVWFGLPFALSMLLAGLFTSGVRSLVALMTTTHEVGLYTAAYSLSQNVLFVMAAAIGSTTYPLAVRAYERGDKLALRAQLHDNFALLLGTMTPAALGMALTSRDLAAQLVGSEFRTGVAELMPWMALTVLLGSIRGTYLDHSFQLGKKSAHQVTVSAGAAVLALLGTLLLVPWLGAVGAPIATSFAMFGSCIHAWTLGRNATRMPIPLTVVAQVLCASAVMALAVLSVPGGEAYSLYLKMALGAVCYSVTCVAVDLLGTRRHFRRLLAKSSLHFRNRLAG